MSRRKDPKDEAIAYVMTAPIMEASTFVQTLTSVVKARAAATVKTGTAPVATATKAAAKPRAVVRDIKVTDPNKPAAEAVQPATPAADSPGTQAALPS